MTPELKCYFDSRQNIVKGETYRNSILQSTFLFKYDTLNNLIEEKVMNQLNELIQTTQFHYDGNNNLIERVYIMKDSTQSRMDRLIRNDIGLITEYQSYNYLNALQYHTQYEYNQYGHMTLFENKIHENKLVYKYRYDRYGNWIVRKVYVEKKLAQKYKRKITYSKGSNKT